MKIDQIWKKQDKLESMFNEQNDKISEILSKLDKHGDTEIETHKKDKDKAKNRSEFYQVNIFFIIISLCCLYFNYQINLYYRKQFVNYQTSCSTNTNKR